MIRIANASGFYGDRFSAVAEMLTGGDIDVLTGDYLAELTMLILGRDQAKNPERGYARTFLRQMRECLALAKDAGVTVVANAGGVNPTGLVEALEKVATELGLDVAIARVDGDDLRGRTGELGLSARDAGGQQLAPLTANAYLGAWGIAEAVRAGADVVVTGRVTDASLVVGPAAARFGWARTDYDALAGAVAAGHVIECGAQATGGNYAFFTELADGGLAGGELAGGELADGGLAGTGRAGMTRPGFPIAEVHADGTSVVTKHPGTGGAVTPGTVTAQLLYEIAGPAYPGPDVTALFDTLTLSEDGPDRVRISGTRGAPPPPELKVGLTALAGYRNEVTFVLTGLDIDAKAELVRAQLDAALGVGGLDAGGLDAGGLDVGTKAPASVRWTLARTDTADAATEEEASALLHCAVTDPEPEVVGRAFSGAAVELALASYPGFHVTAPPAEAAPYGVFTAAAVDPAQVTHRVSLPDGTVVHIDPAGETAAGEGDRYENGADTKNPDTDNPDTDNPDTGEALPPPPAGGPVRSVPLGRIAGARSGDKGGSANLGVWVRSEQAWRWLAHTLTVEELRRLLPETAPLPIERYLLGNLYAVNFVIEGILGSGVAAQARFDPQAKALGEWLRSRHITIPEVLL